MSAAVRASDQFPARLLYKYKLAPSSYTKVKAGSLYLPNWTDNAPIYSDKWRHQKLVEMQYAFEDMVRSGFQPTPQHFARLLSTYGALGKMDLVRKTVESMKKISLQFDSVTYKTFLESLSHLDQDLELYQSLTQAIQENKIELTPDIFNVAFESCIRLGNFKRFHTLFQELCNRFTPDEKAYNYKLTALASKHLTFECLQVLEEMKKNNINVTINSYNAIIRGSIIAKSIANIPKVLEQIEDNSNVTKNQETYSNLVQAYVAAENSGKAYDTIQDMKQAGFQPSVFDWKALLLLLANKKRDSSLHRILPEIEELLDEQNFSHILFEPFVRLQMQHGSVKYVKQLITECLPVAHIESKLVEDIFTFLDQHKESELLFQLYTQLEQNGYLCSPRIADITLSHMHGDYSLKIVPKEVAEFVLRLLRRHDLHAQLNRDSKEKLRAIHVEIKDEKLERDVTNRISMDSYAKNKKLAKIQNRQLAEQHGFDYNILDSPTKVKRSVMEQAALQRVLNTDPYSDTKSGFGASLYYLHLNEQSSYALKSARIVDESDAEIPEEDDNESKVLESLIEPGMMDADKLVKYGGVWVPPAEDDTPLQIDQDEYEASRKEETYVKMPPIDAFRELTKKEKQRIKRIENKEAVYSIDLQVPELSEMGFKEEEESDGYDYDPSELGFAVPDVDENGYVDNTSDRIRSNITPKEWEEKAKDLVGWSNIPTSMLESDVEDYMRADETPTSILSDNEDEASVLSFINPEVAKAAKERDAPIYEDSESEISSGSEDEDEKNLFKDVVESETEFESEMDQEDTLNVTRPPVVDATSKVPSTDEAVTNDNLGLPGINFPIERLAKFDYERFKARREHAHWQANNKNTKKK